MKPKIALTLMTILLALVPAAFAQDDVTPISLEVKVYTDGSTLITYVTESDPTKVRVDVELFGDSYNNLIIKDEDSIPLDSEVTSNGLTIDTIGASELTIIYTTSDLTTKTGPIWDLNLSSPVSTKVILPQGAAIFDLGDIPTDIGTINGAQYVELPAGEVYVSFILALPNLRGEAQLAITEASSYLSSLENQGYVLTDARAELAQAQQLFSSDQFIMAKDKAIQVKETADDTVDDADSAAVEIALADTSVTNARNEGRTDGLPQAEDTLTSAETYYSQGLYIEAETAAKQASQLALSADEPSGGNTMLYIGVLVLLGAAGGGYYYMQNKSPATEAPILDAVPAETEEKAVDLDRIFHEFDDLRLEDREVIKFLAETNGEAFATEIRNRFDMPRSSTWRLIRRLTSLQIVEEAKIGNQSLVRIRKKYLK